MPALYSAGEAGAERVYRKLQWQVSDECLNEHWFLTLPEEQLVIEAWRREYNEERTHSTIRDVTPQEFIHHYHKGAQLMHEFTS